MEFEGEEVGEERGNGGEKKGGEWGCSCGVGGRGERERGERRVVCEERDEGRGERGEGRDDVKGEGGSGRTEEVEPPLGNEGDR